MQPHSLFIVIGIALGTLTSCATTGTTSTGSESKAPAAGGSSTFSSSGEVNTAPTEGTPVSGLQQCLARAKNSADPHLEESRCRRSMRRGRGGGGGG